MSYNFEFTELQKSVRLRVREFARQHIMPIAQYLDQEERFSKELFQKMAGIGLTGCTIDPCYGGEGWDDLTYLMAVEELAYYDSSQAAIIASHNSLALAALNMFGTEEQKERWLPVLCAGDGLWGFALTELSSGSDAARITTYATANDFGGWILNGEKSWITGTGCEYSLGTTVLAITQSTEKDTAHKKFSCFLVPSSAEGYKQKPIMHKMMWRATPTGHLIFQDVSLPKNALLGDKGQGFGQMMQVLNGGRLSIAAMGVGLARSALDYALAFAKTRKSFGKPLIEHQGVAFKLADMATRIEAASNLLYKACWVKMQRQDFAQLASMAKLYSSETAEFCAREAQQIFGARGLMKPHPIERHYRDSALLRIGEGTSEIQRWIISKKLTLCEDFQNTFEEETSFDRK